MLSICTGSSYLRITMGSISYRQQCDGKTNGSSVSPTDATAHSYILSVAADSQPVLSTLRYSVAAGPAH